MSLKSEALELSSKVQTVYDSGMEAGKKSEYDRFWDEFQQNGTRDYYPYAFAGAGWNVEILKPKYSIVLKSSLGGAMGFMSYCNHLNGAVIDLTEFCKMCDFSKARRTSYMFNNANVDNITVDASNSEDATNMFNMDNFSNPVITTINVKFSEKCKGYSGVFGYLKSLINLTLMEGSIISSGLSLKDCTNLSKASIKSVINALSTTTSAYTVTFSKTAVNNAFETSSGAADGTTSQEWADLIATKSNWTISLV